MRPGYEAHNLPDWARSSASESLHLRSVELAIGEAKKYGKPCIPFLRNVEEVIEKLSEKYTKDDEEYNLPSGIAYSDFEEDKSSKYNKAIHNN